MPATAAPHREELRSMNSKRNRVLTVSKRRRWNSAKSVVSDIRSRFLQLLPLSTQFTISPHAHTTCVVIVPGAGLHADSALFYLNKITTLKDKLIAPVKAAFLKGLPSVKKEILRTSQSCYGHRAPNRDFHLKP